MISHKSEEPFIIRNYRADTPYEYPIISYSELHSRHKATMTRQKIRSKRKSKRK